ncbi:MAG: glycoside hydrolase family 35 protein [Chitinophagaceae bacterium]
MKRICLRGFLFFFISCSFLFSGVHGQGKAPHFALGDSTFLLDGRPFQIISGELHYSRIPRAYWKDRLIKAKAMGLNCISIYCFWNVQEPEKGRFDFTGRQDVARFVKLAQQEGLWVILRPGPYVCAEWDFGGFPWWLLKNPAIRVRSRDPRFLSAARTYLDSLGKQLAPLQITHGGPILMVQLENEYGSFGEDKTYLRDLKHMLRGAGFNVPLFAADGSWAVHHTFLPGVLPGCNGETSAQNLKDTVNKYHDGKGPYFIPEYYPGWLDHWGEKFVRVQDSTLIPNIDHLLGSGVSLNFYMFHGGTNFGFMNGANINQQGLEPSITSYDYDAPLSEAGVITPKYLALRQVILRHLPKGTKLPPVPAQPVFQSLPDIHLNLEAGLMDNLPQPVQSTSILSMEDLNQGYGYLIYQTRIPKACRGILKLDRLRDYAIIFLNGKRVGVLDRRMRQDSLEISAAAGSSLDIFVENLGRINFGKQILDNRKGITHQVLLAGQSLKNWKIYSLPFQHFGAIHFHPFNQVNRPPVILKGNFMLNNTSDSFLDMRGWGKGAAWINGHALGRYWYIGPQQTLYVPGPWLKKGKNELIIFEELHSPHPIISGIDHPILDQVQVEKE